MPPSSNGGPVVALGVQLVLSTSPGEFHERPAARPPRLPPRHVRRPAADRTTGLPLLQLPEGSTYLSFGWARDPMAGRRPAPMGQDGLALVAARMFDGQSEITRVRNHEAKILPEIGLIGALAVYDTADVTDDDVTGKLSCGTTILIYRGDAWGSARPSRAGTIDTTRAARHPRTPGSGAKRT